MTRGEIAAETRRRNEREFLTPLLRLLRGPVRAQRDESLVMMPEIG